MAFNNLMDKLRSQGKVIQNSIIALTIFEGILTILIGVLSNKFNWDFGIYFWSLFFLGFLFLSILVIKVAYTKNFTESIADELKSERELYECRRNAARQEQISNFYITSMKNLNGQTCSLDGSNNDLCDSDIIGGVSDLIQPALENMGFILDAVNANSYTIGLYLKEYSRIQNDESIYEDNVIFILKDGLSKSDILEKEMLHDSSLKGEALSIQNALRTSINNNQFSKSEYIANGEEYTIICSTMPYACNEDELLGVLFIISEKLNTIPSDIPNTLTIFNRIISNWVYKYDACVFQKSRT